MSTIGATKRCACSPRRGCSRLRCALPSVEILPRFRAIETTYARGGDVIGLEIAEVHADVSPRPIDGFPGDDAAAARAPHEAQMLVAPRVPLRGATSSPDFHAAAVIVGPQRAIATADGAIARYEHARPARDRNVDRATMAAPADHAAYCAITSNHACRQKWPHDESAIRRLLPQQLFHNVRRWPRN
jgi:hypothetical protein